MQAARCYAAARTSRARLPTPSKGSGKKAVDWATGEVNAGDVSATIFQALGISPRKNYRVGARPVPLAPEGSKPIKTVLA